MLQVAPEQRLLERPVDANNAVRRDGTNLHPGGLSTKRYPPLDALNIPHRLLPDG